MTAVDPNRSALLVMDYQANIIGRLGERGAPLVERAAGLVRAARAAKLPIIHVVIGFRPGYPEVSPRNGSFSALAGSSMFTGAPGGDIPRELGPHDGDIVVVKHRVSAFAGSDLDMVLRARGVETMVLAGISTSGVVLSTLRYAADQDFKLVVVKDCCADPDDEVHRVLIDKVFPKQAQVAAASELSFAAP